VRSTLVHLAIEYGPEKSSVALASMFFLPPRGTLLAYFVLAVGLLLMVLSVIFRSRHQLSGAYLTSVYVVLSFPAILVTLLLAVVAYQLLAFPFRSVPYACCAIKQSLNVANNAGSIFLCYKRLVY